MPCDAADRLDCRTAPCGTGCAWEACRNLRRRGRISLCRRSRWFSALVRLRAMIRWGFSSGRRRWRKPIRLRYY